MSNEFMIISMAKEEYLNGTLPEHEVLKVIVKDDLFKDDEQFLKLYKTKKKADTDLEKYKHKKRWGKTNNN